MKEQLEARLKELEQSHAVWLSRQAVATEQVAQHKGAMDELRRLLGVVKEGERADTADARPADA